jgi:transcriptional regulator with XRE-family HTH domain
MSTENVDLTPAQCRAGRALLGITQPELAKRAGLGLSTIVDFERARRRISDEAALIIREALEKADVLIIDENGGGAGVRMRRPSDRKPQKK